MTFPGGVVEQAAQRCVRDLAVRVTEHNRRIADIEHDIPTCSPSTATPRAA